MGPFSPSLPPLPLVIKSYIRPSGLPCRCICLVGGSYDIVTIFIVPRLLQRDFGRVNKHILFIGQFDDVPVLSHFDPLVPFLLFYLPPFRRELPVSPSSSGRLDPSPIMPVPHWVDAQMEELRGL